MKGIRKRNGSYYLEFYDPGRWPERREFPLRTRDKREALQIAARLRNEFVAGVFDPWEDKRPGRIALDEAITAFLRTKRRQTKQTQKAYRSTLRLFAGACRAASPDAIRERDIERFVLGKGQKGKPYTVKTQQAHLQRLGTFLRWCEEEGYVRQNVALACWKRLEREQPKRRKKARPRRDFMMPEELKRLSAAVHLDAEAETLEGGGRRWSRAYFRDVLELTCCTGLREGEVCNLNRGHVRLRQIETERGMQPLAGQVLIANYEDAERGLIETKTGEERLIPLVPRAALILHRRLDEATNEDPTAPVFVGPRLRRRLSPQTVSQRFTEYRRQVGLRPQLTFHSTRHTFVSWMLMLGLPIYHVKELAGHSSLDITEQYAHTARRYLHGQAREIMMAILSFYCPGLEPRAIASVLGAGLHGGGLGGYAWGGASLLDVLFGASLYRAPESVYQVGANL